jgi:AraC family transcriptional regulator of adaptative response/methylated-DNA-[protein]-cysteine methyltransferase
MDSMILPAAEHAPLSQAALDYRRIEKALRFLHANFQRHPSLAETAAHVHLSGFHFERLFQRWAGTSPKRFLQFLTADYAKAVLRQSESVLEAAHATRLSGSGCRHDLFLNCEAVTPGTCKQRGNGIVIRYGIHVTPFGDCLFALTEKGLCALRFVREKSAVAEIAELRSEWCGAAFLQDQKLAGETARRLFQPANHGESAQFHLHLRGTNFQLKVWQILLSMPSGTLATYSKIAALTGCPRAARAVGTAIGKNPVAFLIPCHRVIQSLGTLGNYRWGAERKAAIVGWEAAGGKWFSFKEAGVL